MIIAGQFRGMSTSVDGGQLVLYSIAAAVIEMCIRDRFPTEGGVAVLVVRWDDLALPDGSTDLMEDAARSFQLALEREDAVVAHQETAALRRSQEMQQGFLSRLSHELRTPLTAVSYTHLDVYKRQVL